MTERIEIPMAQRYETFSDMRAFQETPIRIIYVNNSCCTAMGTPEDKLRISGNTWQTINSQASYTDEDVKCEICGNILTNHNMGIFSKRCRDCDSIVNCSIPGCRCHNSTGDHRLCQAHALETGEFVRCELTEQVILKSIAIEFEQNRYHHPGYTIDFYCSSCNAPQNNDYNENRIYIDTNHQYCCDECALDDGYRQCEGENCGEWHREENLYWDDDNGGYYCSDCYRDIRRRHRQIEERNPSKRIYATKGQEPTFGFELELNEWPEEHDEIWLPNTWGIHGDSTTGSGYEVVTPPYTMSQIKGKMKPICDYLIRHSSVTKKEGTHMHIGNFLNNDHAVRFYQLCIESERLWSTWLISQSRKQNLYCIDSEQYPIRIDKTWQGQDKIHGDNRYVKTNIKAYQEHGTIEIRAHQGTLEHAKITNWAFLFQQIWFKAKYEATSPRTDNLKVWFDDLNIPSDIQAYYLDRVQKMYEVDIGLEEMKPDMNRKTHSQIYTGNEEYTDEAMWKLLYKEGVTKFSSESYEDDRKLWGMICICRQRDEYEMPINTSVWIQPLQTGPQIDPVTGYSMIQEDCNCAACRAYRITSQQIDTELARMEERTTE